MDAARTLMPARAAGARRAWVDVLRGIAIVLMVPANFSPLFSEPHALWFRILASLAAPTFVTLSTGMVILNAEKHDLRYYVLRGGIVVALGALVDVAVGLILPLTSFDVLYLIGLALPIVYAARRLTTSQLASIGLLFFVVGFMWQKLIGYRGEPLEIDLDEVFWPGIRRVLLSWFVDGWFPVFPWAGYAFFGAGLFRSLLARPDDRIPARWVLAGALAVAIGFAFLFARVTWLPSLANGGIMESRTGYSEIFYPPTPSYLLASLGGVVLLCWVAQYAERITVLSGILRLFGRYSMLIYILHQALAEHVLSRLIALSGKETLDDRMVCFLVVLGSMTVLCACCRVVEYAKKFRSPTSLPMQVLLGR